MPNQDVLSELRILHEEICTSDGGECEMMALVRRGTDEIAQLRRALREIIDGDYTAPEGMKRIARDALGNKPPQVETTLRLPSDPQDLLVTTARDAGFSETQWKAMFYEQGPYDVTFPCFTTKKFIALLLERLQQPVAAKVTRCPHCHDTGWTDTPDVYADGSMATSRRCPRGCSAKA